MFGRKKIKDKNTTAKRSRLFKYYHNRFLKQVETCDENYFLVPDFEQGSNKRDKINTILAIILIVFSFGLAAPIIFDIFYTNIFSEETVLSHSYLIRSLIFFHNLGVSGGMPVIVTEGETIRLPNGIRIAYYGAVIHGKSKYLITNLCLRDRLEMEVYNKIMEDIQQGKKILKM